MNTLLKRTLLKATLLLPLALVPVLSLAADHGRSGHSGGFREHSSHNSWRGPAHVVRPYVGIRNTVGLGIGLGLGYGIGYRAFGAPYYPYNYGYPGSYYPSRTVVVEHNTYIEPEYDAPRPSARNETSLLRDLQGRCYQRTFDRNGNELRTELDPSECDF